MTGGSVRQDHSWSVRSLGGTLFYIMAVGLAGGDSLHRFVHERRDYGGTGC